MSASTPAERLRTALDMFELGEQMMRSRLRRERADMDEEQLEEALRRWLHERPGAEFGDFPGRASARVLRGSQRVAKASS
ncbi:hypothetical protein [Piscicoccus intestinalis]|uniref:hypothetical protein n=1 Tax=Piscicoccus intestinalis TaxID=746033 RepID=UPI0012EECB3C|nr:hypothetical protein [Piscicoccus intestinalis]